MSSPEFVIENGVLLEYNGPGGWVVLPEGLTAIEAYAFAGNRNVIGIQIPEGVTEIGEEAFSGCSRLTSLVLPDSLKRLGSGILYECEEIREVQADGLWLDTLLPMTDGLEEDAKLEISFLMETEGLAWAEAEEQYDKVRRAEAEQEEDPAYSDNPELCIPILANCARRLLEGEVLPETVRNDRLLFLSRKLAEDPWVICTTAIEREPILHLMLRESLFFRKNDLRILLDLVDRYGSVSAKETVLDYARQLGMDVAIP